MTDPLGLFGPIFTTDEMVTATSDRAWLQAMLDVEAALAQAEADAGIIPDSAARAIAACCVADHFDIDGLGRSARLSGNPVIPLVAALTDRVGGVAGGWVHWGATSQDILDSAAMLVARRSVDVVLTDLDGMAAACADLADQHRETLMAGRTLLQHALPITFGLKAAGWLGSTLDVRLRLGEVRDNRLAAQLGGAAGTLASLGPQGPDVMANLAARLGLSAPLLPWPTARARIADLATALAIVAGATGKVALDVALLMQTEVAEAFEPAGPGRGGSSTLPQKRNPVGAASISAAVRRTHALVPVILGAMVQEHERAVGGWQAEWQTLTEMLRLTGGAVARAREMLAGLEVDPARMLANVDLTAGRLMAERVTLHLAKGTGRSQAKDIVAAAAARSATSGRTLREELVDDPAVAGQLSAGDLDELFDPTGYLGASNVFIDRVLESYRSMP
jgi:3-carboxy-cis,cis-muconate cycloisomerase